MTASRGSIGSRTWTELLHLMKHATTHLSTSSGLQACCQVQLKTRDNANLARHKGAYLLLMSRTNLASFCFTSSERNSPAKRRRNTRVNCQHVCDSNSSMVVSRFFWDLTRKGVPKITRKQSGVGTRHEKSCLGTSEAFLRHFRTQWFE